MSHKDQFLDRYNFYFHIAPLPDAILDYNLNCLFYVGDSQVNISPWNVQEGGGGGGGGG